MSAADERPANIDTARLRLVVLLPREIRALIEEIGWGIAEAWRRRGFATEAASGVIEWALGQPGAKSLSATIADDNVVSQNLAAKLGMIRTGQVRRQKPVWSRPAGLS